MTDNELNALVAEKVMGQHRVGDCPLGDSSCMGKYEPMVNGRPCLPDYANDIAAAWSLAEEEDKFILRSLEHKWDYWLVWYQRTIDGDAEYVTAPTAPRAICLAALKAVGVEVE